jgi:hypothetical protein
MQSSQLYLVIMDIFLLVERQEYLGSSLLKKLFLELKEDTWTSLW